MKRCTVKHLDFTT